MAQGTKNGPYSPEERRFMQNFNSSTYHIRHRDERNDKTRVRMAALRLRERSLPKALQEQRQEARRASAKKYRERNAWRLAQKAHEARQEARDKKTREQTRLARLDRREKRLQAECRKEELHTVNASPQI